jgi:adenylate kinase
VISYELPIEVIVERLSGRRTCPRCQAVYHVTAMPPKRAGVCDQCGTALIQRDDDRPDAVRIRMETYAKSTQPLVEFYRRRGLLVPVAATSLPEETYQRTVTALENLRK